MKREYKILTALVVSSLMGFSAMTAEAAAVTLTGDDADVLITGNSDTGTASGNTLNLNGVTTSTSSTTAAGYTRGSDDASSNTLNITGGSLGGNIYGGFTLSGKADNNHVIINSTAEAGSVYGGAGRLSADGNIVETAGTVSIVNGGYVSNTSGDPDTPDEANDNKVVITDGNVGSVYVAHTERGDTANNRLEISGGTVGDVYTVTPSFGDAKNNVTQVTGGTINNIWGAFVGTSGDAIDNEVTISNATVTGTIYGAYAVGQYAKESTTNNLIYNTYSNAEGNSVAISGTSSVGGDVFGTLATGSAEGNSVEISDTSSVDGNVYGGFGMMGNAEGNSVTIEDEVSLTGTGKNVYGGYSVSGDVTGNSVEISTTGTVASTVYGGYLTGEQMEGDSTPGTASGNTVKVSNATATGTIYGAKIGESDGNGGFTGSGDATGNTVTIESGTINNAVYGGQTASGDANGNNIIINGGTIEEAGGTTSVDLFAGESKSGNANNNTVTMTAGTVAANMIGGYSDSNSKDQTGTGTANGNIVKISGGTVDGTVTGGQSRGTGSASGNQVTVSGTGAVTGMLIGGHATGTGTADNNVLTIESGSIPIQVTAGLADGSSATGNTLNIAISGGNSLGAAYAGHGQTDANDNKVIMTSGTVGTVTAGYAVTGDASNNTVEMSSGTALAVIAAQSGEGKATDNAVTMTGGSAEMVAGGYGAAGASGNDVTISNAAAGSSDTTDAVWGGTSDKGDAVSNTVTISGSDITGIVIGGKAQDTGSADNNTVSIESGSITGEVYGGQANYGSSTGNTVTIGTTGEGQLSGAYGGTGRTAAKNNKIIFNGGTTAMLIGGFVEGTDGDIDGAVGNIVEMNGGTSSITAGGYANGSAPATGNNVTVTGGTTETVLGGKADGDTNDNIVTISGGTITGNIYGGQSAEESSTGNTVTIKGGDINGIINGGATDNETGNNQADNNTVTIESGNVTATVAGGNSNYGTASGNTVTINTTGTGTLSAVYGAEGRNATQDNKVIFNGGTAGTLYGGYTTGRTDGTLGSINNTVEINGGTVELTAGANSGVSATGNTVIVTGGNAGMVMGAMSQEKASENKVVISGGKAGTTQTNSPFGVVGALAMGSDALSNTVTISGGEIVGGNVIGGYAMQYGEGENHNANGNTVNFSGGTLGGNLYGGESDAGAANDNTVNILGGTLNPEMSLYGGYSTTESKNNTYNMYTKGQTVADFAYFQNLNFYVPEGTTAGETMLTVTGNAAVSTSAVTLMAVQDSTTTDGATDVSGATVLGGVQRTTKLNPGEEINLLYNANGITTDDTSYGTIEGLDTVTAAGFINYKAIVEKKDANTIVITIPKDDKGTPDPDTKILPEDRENAANTIKNAGDIIAGSALHAAEGAWIESHDIEAKFVPYAIVGGYDLHYNTGSYIDSNGMAANVGFVRRNQHEGHIDTIMPFFEYGKSHYASYLDTGARGDGRQHYTGGGILLRRDLDSGLYYEGVVRAGYLKGDFHGMIAQSMSRYDSGAPYIAAQAGLGKIYTRNRDSYDIYGKFFYTYLGSDSAVVHSGYGDSKYDFDSINSYVTRLGMRWTRDFDQVRSLYAGIGWDYEFDSKARATYAGWTTPSPTVKGSSGFFELGWKSKIDSTHPWGVDLRATGWTGKQEGGTFFATISHSF